MLICLPIAVSLILLAHYLAYCKQVIPVAFSRFLILILSSFFLIGTNWVGQIITDLVTTCAKNNEDETNSVNDELDEFPYLEVGDAEKYQVGTKCLLILLITVIDNIGCIYMYINIP